MGSNVTKAVCGGWQIEFPKAFIHPFMKGRKMDGIFRGYATPSTASHSKLGLSRVDVEEFCCLKTVSVSQTLQALKQNCKEGSIYRSVHPRGSSLSWKSGMLQITRPEQRRDHHSSDIMLLLRWQFKCQSHLRWWRLRSWNWLMINDKTTSVGERRVLIKPHVHAQRHWLQSYVSGSTSGGSLIRA